MKYTIAMILLVFCNFAMSQKRVSKIKPLPKQQEPLTQQEIAEGLVNDYLLKYLNDPHSYENVGFTDIDSVFTNINDNAYYPKAKERVRQIVTVKMYIYNRAISDRGVGQYIIDTYKDSIKKFIKDTLDYNRDIRFIEKSYKREQKGWRMLHTYRAKNAYGGLVLQTDTVNFNVDLTRVESMNKVEN